MRAAARAAGRSPLGAARRTVYTVLCVEDHAVMTSSARRAQAVRDVIARLAPTVAADAFTAAKLTPGYMKPCPAQSAGKGEFDAAQAADLEGRPGSAPIWSSVRQVLREHPSVPDDARLIVVTNGADNASRLPLRGKRGCAELLRSLRSGERLGDGPGPAQGTPRSGALWVVGLDVLGHEERQVMSKAAAESGGAALLLDTTGAEANGTSLDSAEAGAFFTALAGERAR
eukprot:TRINITY_DN47872_c0_g1_i1.p2 TRINITY_DN47872_c0_g1~~TRINITY_DN47872_c0_g1_i1.p2  ORF type:complete len:229 (+),score=69.11 TRINITY_DN47872_c0_g1_i1:80-766(+)